jgi:hypothetical protein
MMRSRGSPGSTQEIRHKALHCRLYTQYKQIYNEDEKRNMTSKVHLIVHCPACILMIEFIVIGLYTNQDHNTERQTDVSRVMSML